VIKERGKGLKKSRLASVGNRRYTQRPLESLPSELDENKTILPRCRFCVVAL